MYGGTKGVGYLVLGVLDVYDCINGIISQTKKEMAIHFNK
jgi:hypothetical protein